MNPLNCAATRRRLNAYHDREVFSFFRPAVVRLQRTCSGPL